MKRFIYKRIKKSTVWLVLSNRMRYNMEIMMIILLAREISDGELREAIESAAYKVVEVQIK